MTLYTGYYAKHAKHPQAVAISCGVPKWYAGRVNKIVAPSWALIAKYKGNEIDEADYEAEYRAFLDWLGTERVLSGFTDGDVMLCYEKPSDFCHRHILAAWLTEHGHTVTELGAD